LRAILTLIFLLLHSAAALAQEPNQPSLKVGLALSGGGAKGMTHIGVLKVLEAEGIPVDVIAGTSMGAIVGGLYALGYSAAELEEIATSQNWTPLFSDASPRRSLSLEERLGSDGVLASLPIEGTQVRIPGGLVEGQEAMARLARLTWGYHHVEDLSLLPIPFVAVATELRTGAATPLGKGVTLADAIRASMSLPTFFSPARIGKHLYLDGGMSRNLPAVDARHLGADVLIGVDVADLPDSLQFDRASFLDVLAHASWYQGYKSDIQQRDLVDILIRPDISVGSATSFDLAMTWISIGEEAARAALPEIREALLARGIPTGAAVQRRPPTARKRVIGITIGGVDGPGRTLVEQLIGLELPADLGPDELEETIGRVYGTGLFELVTYRVVPASDRDGYHLQVDAVVRKMPDRIGMGVRYDTHFGTQLLWTLSLRNRVRYGSTTQFRLRVGDQNELRASFFSQLGAASGVNAGGQFGYVSAPIRLFLPDRYARARGGDPKVPVLGLRMEVLSASAFLGRVLTANTSVRFNLEAEYVAVAREVAGSLAPPDLELQAPDLRPDDNHSVVTAGLLLVSDSRDGRSFPTRGRRLSVDFRGGLSGAEPMVGTSSGVGTSSWIGRARVDFEQFLPTGPQTTLLLRAAASYGAGDRLPLSLYSFVGGAYTTTVLPGTFLPLYGAPTHERFGRKAFMVLVGLQEKVGDDVYVRVMANMGGVSDIFMDHEKDTLTPALLNLLDEEPIFGVALELALRTPLGPARALVSSGGQDRTPSLSLSIGYNL
jgi:NTE family protein